jgi:hypothetical protein
MKFPAAKPIDTAALAISSECRWASLSQIRD